MNFKESRSVNDNQIVKKYINSDKDYSINTRLNSKIKIRFLGQKQESIKISEMSSSILVKCSLKCKLGFLCK